jgi:signal transduction histidine kinase
VTDEILDAKDVVRRSAGRRWTPLVMSAAALGPPLIALVGHLVMGTSIHPWSLFIAAVLLSAWLGGFAIGLISTAISTVLVWLFLVPPGIGIRKDDPLYAAAGLGFIAMGVAVSLLQQQFKNSKRDVAAALDTTYELNERLERAVTDLREAQRIGRIGSWFYDPKTDLARWSDELFRIHDRRGNNMPQRVHGGPPLFTPESGEVVDAALQKLLKDGQPYEVDAEVVRADGSTGWVTIRGVAVRNRAGEIVGASGTTQDITELKRLQKLRQEWMSVVAHDLRQPIGVNKMAAELLPELHNGDVSKTEADIVRRIRSASIDLARMVDDLLDVSRIEAHRLTLHRSWIDPHAVIEETVARILHITTGVRINVVNDAPATRVYADAGRIGQVLGNLLSNAIKYGDRGSDIEIRLSQCDEGVTIAVTNRGKGISTDDLSKLFHRFVRTRDDRKSGVAGLGLGLYIAKGLIDAHGGRLWGESTPNQTTTFSFTLPTEQRLARAA